MGGWRCSRKTARRVRIPPFANEEPSPHQGLVLLATAWRVRILPLDNTTSHRHARATAGRARAEAARSPAQVLWVRYEDLTRDAPAREVERVTSRMWRLLPSGESYQF
jgi:hypothetical protein